MEYECCLDPVECMQGLWPATSNLRYQLLTKQSVTSKGIHRTSRAQRSNQSVFISVQMYLCLCAGRLHIQTVRACLWESLDSTAVFQYRSHGCQSYPYAGATSRKKDCTLLLAAMASPCRRKCCQSQPSMKPSTCFAAACQFLLPAWLSSWLALAPPL